MEVALRLELRKTEYKSVVLPIETIRPVDAEVGIEPTQEAYETPLAT